MSEFVRKKIPQLKSRQSRVGKASVSRRSFPVGPDMFFRVYKDDLLELEIEFLTSSDDLVVVLHTNLGNYDGDWRDITFETSDSKVFTLKLDIDRCGLFRFKVRYSLDGGKNWYWDRVPFSEVMVDPAFTRDVRLYTFIPTISGHLGNWKKQLKRIAEMKFNVVHLLPVTTMGWSESPYAADDLFSIDESFLELASDKDNLKQFEDFVVAAKELGIRLCIDLVLNHVSVSSNMVNMCPEWIVADSDEPDGLKRAGCWHKNQWVKWEDLAKINYNHPSRTVRRDIWDYMKQYAMFWTNYANYTGGMIRFDNLHSSHEQFITELTRDLRREFTDIVILAEYFSDELAIERRVPEWGLNLLLANSWEYSFTPQLREYISYIHKISGKLRYFTPITSHDTGSPTQEFGSALATLPRYFINAFFTSGQTGIVQGVEYGMPEKIDFIGRKPRTDFDNDPIYAPFITKINSILKQYKTFTNSGNITFIDSDHNAILAAHRSGDFCGEQDFLLLANLDIQSSQSIVLNLKQFITSGEHARLHDLFSDEYTEINDTCFSVTLPPCGVRILQFA